MTVLKNQSGMSLMEVLAASAVVIITVLIIDQLAVDQAKSFVNGSRRNDYITLQTLINANLSNPTVCSKVLKNLSPNTFDFVAAGVGGAGQEVDMNFSVDPWDSAYPATSARPFIDQGHIKKDQDIPAFGVQILQSQLANAVAMSNPDGSDPTQKYYSVRFRIQAAQHWTDGTLNPLPIEEIADFFIFTDSSDKILGCWTQSDFSPRVRCANKGMIYVPSGYKNYLPDADGCVSLKAFSVF